MVFHRRGIRKAANTSDAPQQDEWGAVQAPVAASSADCSEHQQAIVRVWISAHAQFLS